MSNKKERVLKVYEVSSMRKIPLIKISGMWLEKLGFKIGNYIQLECHENELIIKNIDKEI
ncbi:SymE family type I addiction module toxin [uncultured Thomasclavelia sp.]|uniref:SymE family type I addiction module toxin n=1 Tax=uncultured Thomasclavelia sp. TaxID=3025759 RepID=UPI0025EA7CE4|nr:SymE family type I addiction module toxin [uncultured Thomasclavelia sp.]